MRKPETITAAREKVHKAERRLQKATLALPDVREANADEAVVALREAIEILTSDEHDG